MERDCPEKMENHEKCCTAGLLTSAGKFSLGMEALEHEQHAEMPSKKKRWKNLPEVMIQHMPMQLVPLPLLEQDVDTVAICELLPLPEPNLDNTNAAVEKIYLACLTSACAQA